MKKVYINLLSALVLATGLVSCVTGNDESEVLMEHEKALAKTARVLDLAINDVAISRDSLSNWRYVYANPGEQLNVSGIFRTGDGASEGTLQVSQYLYSTATSFGLDPAEDTDYTVLESMSFGSGSKDLSMDIVVPLLDNDGEEFHSGDHINFGFWSWNNLQGYGYTDFTVEIK